MPCFEHLGGGCLSSSKVDKDSEKEEIIRNVMELIYVHIDNRYTPDPALVQQSRRDIEQYIKARVAHKFRQQVELHGLREKIAAISQQENSNPLATLSALPARTKPDSVIRPLKVSFKEIPAPQKGSVNEENPKVPKRKSVLRKIFKFYPKQRETENDEAGNKRTSILGKITKRISKR